MTSPIAAPVVATLTFDPGQIYYFSNPFLNTTEPHYHICLEQDGGGVLFMACCTSQFEKRKRYIELAKLPTTTLVWMAPDGDNNFKTDTYVDCNSCFGIEKSYLLKQQKAGSLKVIGYIKPSHLEQIVGGTIDSPRVEEYKKDAIKGLLD